MMRSPGGLSLAGTVLVLIAADSLANDDEHAAVLALMEKAFAAVSSGNVDAWRAIQLAEGTSLSFRPSANGAPGDLEMRMTTNEAIAAADAAEDHVYMERWTGRPVVMMRGPIAVIWGEYEFWIDGEFSHCGIDSVDVVKADGVWKIANWMWTVEKDDCPTDPAGQAR